MAGVVTMTVADKYWWIAPTISFLALIAIIWFQWGQHVVRSYRTRRPFHADMSMAPSTPGSYCRELHVPPNALVSLQLRIIPTLHYKQTDSIFGFDGPAKDRPLPVSVRNEFIKDGLTREQSPKTTSSHYIDHGDCYHIKEPLERTKPNYYNYGFIVKTTTPGRYPVILEVITDCGEAKPKERLTLIVEERT
jgi:hypothetical protein